MVLVLARPDLIDERPTFGATVRNHTRLDLTPLADEEMDLLLLGLVPGIPPEALRAIRDRAAGIPLYAVETVRMLLDQGSLTQSDGRFRLASDLGQLAVPDSLQSLLGARLDALDPASRELVGVAAVLGCQLHRRRARRPAREVAVGGRTDDRPPHRPGGRAPGRRPALAGAGPAPLRPGRPPGGRLRPAVAPGPAGPSSRSRPALRGGTERGAGRRRREPLPERAPQRPRRHRPGRAGGPDVRRPRGRRREVDRDRRPFERRGLPGRCRLARGRRRVPVPPARGPGAGPVRRRPLR